MRLQPLLDASLPEDIEEGLGDDSTTYSIGAALDHIGGTCHLVSFPDNSYIAAEPHTPIVADTARLRSLCKAARLKLPSQAGKQTIGCLQLHSQPECVCRLWALPCDAAALLWLRMGC